MDPMGGKSHILGRRPGALWGRKKQTCPPPPGANVFEKDLVGLWPSGFPVCAGMGSAQSARGRSLWRVSPPASGRHEAKQRSTLLASSARWWTWSMLVGRRRFLEGQVASRCALCDCAQVVSQGLSFWGSFRGLSENVWVRRILRTWAPHTCDPPISPLLDFECPAFSFECLFLASTHSF